MFPTVLLFQPEAARALLEYRIRTLGGALDNARKLGYQGAKFAWESAGSGREVCPEDVYGAQEIHVNGAVVLAFQLYYHATQDVQLFREAGGWDVVRAVAEFWCSRVEWSPKEEEYQLKGVMPPDEYHSGVDNSVYTNVLVQNNLRFAAALARDLGRPVPTEWLAVAEKIKVPFDPRQDFHPEFDGYQPGEEVKQADVVLLGYPVPFHLSPHTRRRNLEIYEAATSPRGPAMTWSMFAVGWMELKDPRRAQDFLERSFANIAEPFKVGGGGSTLVPSTPASTLAPGVGAGAQPQERSPKGVDRECRWLRRCELPDRHGGLPAGGALWIHRVPDHRSWHDLRPHVSGGGLCSARPGPVLPGEQAGLLLL